MGYEETKNMRFTATCTLQPSLNTPHSHGDKILIATHKTDIIATFEQQNTQTFSMSAIVTYCMF